jgi:hypothetical protein
MSPAQRDGITQIIEGYFLRLEAAQGSEPYDRIIALSRLMLDVGADRELRAYFREFLDEMSRQVATSGNGSGRKNT